MLTKWVRSKKSEVEKLIRAKEVSWRKFPRCKYVSNSFNLSYIECTWVKIHFQREKLQIHSKTRSFFPDKRFNGKLIKVQVKRTCQVHLKLICIWSKIRETWTLQPIPNPKRWCTKAWQWRCWHIFKVIINRTCMNRTNHSWICWILSNIVPSSFRSTDLVFVSYIWSAADRIALQPEEQLIKC